MKNPMHTKHNSSSFRAPFGAPGGRCMDVKKRDVCWWLMEMFVGSKIFCVCEVEGSSVFLGEDINPMTGLVYLPTDLP